MTAAWPAGTVGSGAGVMSVMYFNNSRFAPVSMIIGWPTTKPRLLPTETLWSPMAAAAVRVSEPDAVTNGAGELGPLIQVSRELTTPSLSSSKVSEQGVVSAGTPMQIV